MQLNLTPPPGLRGDEKSQLIQMHSFLFQLTEQLNEALVQTDDRLAAAERITGLSAEEGSAAENLTGQYAQLKSLIIKTAHTVQVEMDMLVTELKSNYISVSDWGAYEENIKRTITDTAEKTIETFDYESMLGDVFAGSVEFESYRQSMLGTIARGIIGEEEDGTPIFGIAIGEELTTREVTVGGKTELEIVKTGDYALYTADGITFMHGDARIAWFKDGKLSCNAIDVADTVSIGGQWEISRTNGFTIKWIGGV